MSDTVWIALIVGLVVIIAVYALRDRLKRLKVRLFGASTELEADRQVGGPETRANTVVRRTKQSGIGNTVDIGRDAIVEDNEQVGIDQKLVVRPDPSPPGKSR